MARANSWFEKLKPTGPTLRFSEVAAAAGIDPVNLRNWLKRNELKLTSPQPEQGWRKFVATDAVLLAVMAPLVDVGFSVEHANRVASAILADEHADLSEIVTRGPGEVRVNCGIAIFLWAEGDDWNYTVFRLKEEAPWHLAKTAIVLQLGGIIGDVFDRMGEIPFVVANDGNDNQKVAGSIA